jgi:hypothetical protein
MGASSLRNERHQVTCVSLCAAAGGAASRAGIAPDRGGAPVRLTPSEIEHVPERSPLAPAIGMIHSKLSRLDTEARHISAVADADANLLWGDW